jgi:energy-coupling factor transport system permease protein
VRLVLLIILAALLTLTTSPIELTDALEKMFGPLKKLKVPTHEIVMMLTLSLRFIPTLLEEAQRLKNAQVSRGASFDGHLIQRIKSIVPLILPLFISAFRRADDLALAMDSRCYTGGEGRSSFRRLKFATADYAVLFFMFAILFLLLI